MTVTGLRGASYRRCSSAYSPAYSSASYCFSSSFSPFSVSASPATAAAVSSSRSRQRCVINLCRCQTIDTLSDAILSGNVQPLSSSSENGDCGHISRHPTSLSHACKYTCTQIYSLIGYCAHIYMHNLHVAYKHAFMPIHRSTNKRIVMHNMTYNVRMSMKHL